jgi:hypothetical protein
MCDGTYFTLEGALSVMLQMAIKKNCFIRLISNGDCHCRLPVVAPYLRDKREFSPKKDFGFASF